MSVVPLSDLSIHVPARHALKRAGVYYVHQLVEMDVGDVLAVRGIGRRWLLHIRDTLAANGLHLKGEGTSHWQQHSSGIVDVVRRIMLFATDDNSRLTVNERLKLIAAECRCVLTIPTTPPAASRAADQGDSCPSHEKGDDDG